MDHGPIDQATADGIVALRERIAAENIPPSVLDESLNIATWNIREFGKNQRDPRSTHYIAEILHQFDLIAIAELREDLGDLRRVMELLGPYWKVVYSDFIGDAGGNGERMAYLYDKRMADFTGLAAEADAPRLKNAAGDYLPRYSWWRSPYIATFRAGSVDFMLITAHIRWAGSVTARKKPMQLLADWVEERRNHPHVADRDIILMGDFNIPSRRSSLYKIITGKGMDMPAALGTRQYGTNLEQNKRYDQILHYPQSLTFSDRGGVVDFYQGDFAPLYGDTGLSDDQITFQLSDHLPLWVQLRTDTVDQHLNVQ